MVTENPAVLQMRRHGVDIDHFKFASFCFGRGWRGHTTLAAARRAANRDAAKFAREFRGGEPQHLVASTADGKAV